ncbi:MAG TPA: 50S ribosomal protein L10 [Phycisphaerae bacterium]|jgi:large subunit ribosomal protein L10|nr:50S ribosomal protein L10 [Phycisphaerae bacterium]
MSKRVKALITAELKSKFQGADSVVVVDYIGIDSKTTSGIRSDFRKKQVKMTVVRNALAAKALEGAGLKGVGGLLKGTNAVVYGGESVVDVVKEIVEQAKKVDKLKIKGSIVEGQLLDTKATEALAKLPNKKELQGIIVGQILGPGRKIAGQLKGPASKIAGQIKSVEDKAKDKEGAAPAAA